VLGAELLKILVSYLSGICPNKKRPAEAGQYRHYGMSQCQGITCRTNTQHVMRGATQDTGINLSGSCPKTWGKFRHKKRVDPKADPIVC